jgi:hypothetical protein
MSDELLSLIHSDVKEIKKDISELKVTSGKQQVSLDEHMKRSDNLEALISHLDENKIEPMQADINQIRGVYKFLGFLIGLGAMIAAFLLLRGGH